MVTDSLAKIGGADRVAALATVDCNGRRIGNGSGEGSNGVVQKWQTVRWLKTAVQKRQGAPAGTGGWFGDSDSGQSNNNDVRRSCEHRRIGGRFSSGMMVDGPDVVQKRQEVEW